MKIILVSILILSSLFQELKAQDESKIFTLPADTILRQQGFIPSLNLDYKFDDLFLNDQFNPYQSSTAFFDDTSTIWLRTELSLSFNAESEEDKHFTSPLYDQYLEDSKFNLFRSVLGMAQLSAVGYLAYRHIKKYGFR
jgi:hypothetical protein